MHSPDGNDPPDQDDPIETYRCSACGWRSPGGEAEDAGPYGGCPRCNGALVAASSLQGYAVRLIDDLDESTTEVLSLEQQLLEARQDQARRREALRSWLEQHRASDAAWRRDELRKARDALQEPLRAVKCVDAETRAWMPGDAPASDTAVPTIHVRVRYIPRPKDGGTQ